MKIIWTGLILLISSTGQSSETPSKDRLPAIAGKGKATWHCARPPVVPDSSPAGLKEVATPEAYSIELQCLVKWLNEYSDKGELGKHAHPDVYAEERKRAQTVLKNLSDWTESLRVRERTQAARSERKKAERLYLSGVEFYKKGEYDKARMEWNSALELDPANSDAKYGLGRIKKLYEGPDDADDLRGALGE